MREQLEPEEFMDDAQDETRPALADEAKQALEMAERRRRSLQPIIDKDAETSAMMPNDYQAALERLKAERASQRPPPEADKTTRDRPKDLSDPSFALAQLAAARSASSAPSPLTTPMGIAAISNSGPLSRPPSMNGTMGTGPNRPLSMQEASAIPSARDLAANVARRSLSDAKPSSQSIPPPMPPPPATDDPDVIKSLMGGAPAPSPPRIQGLTPSDAPPTSGHTMPMTLNQLGLKPSTGPVPLAPQRTPAPMAVVGKGGANGNGGGLMIQTDRPGSMPPAGFSVKTSPSAQSPMRAPMPSRPPGAFGPSPSTPPKQYDFKRWSSPDISEMPSDGAPVTFQVYTAQDVAQGRGPQRSMPVIETQQSSGGSIAMKVGLAILGGVIVLVTAAAVIMVSTDDPKKPNAPITPASESAAPSVTVAPEVPTVLVIPGDPTDEPTPSAVPTGKKPKPPKPTGGGGGGTGGGGNTPPPNPYGKP